MSDDSIGDTFTGDKKSDKIKDGENNAGDEYVNDGIARGPRIGDEKTNECSCKSTDGCLPELNVMNDGTKKITSENATDDECG